MDVLVDNKDLKSYFGIDVLDYTDAFSLPAERENEREWYDKSGVDRNLVNAKFEAKEFSLKCLIESTNEATAYGLANTLIEYMLSKKVFVLSFRDSSKGIRECFLCERSKVVNAKINIRQQNSLYVFKLGLKDVNPNAIKYKTSILASTATIDYEKGQTASIFWGNGDNGLVNNSGFYTKDDYLSDGLVDIIVDLDKDADIVVSLVANFTADKTSGVKPELISFTDTSTGNISVWSWVIEKDGTVIYTSAEQHPSFTFDQEGTFTVKLQVFNEAAGSDIEIKTDYITIRNARMLRGNSGGFALRNNTGDYGIIN